VTRAGAARLLGAPDSCVDLHVEKGSAG